MNRGTLTAMGIGAALFLAFSGTAFGQDQTPVAVVGTGADVVAWAFHEFGVPGVIAVLLWRLGGNVGKFNGIPVSVSPIEHIHRFHPETAAQVESMVKIAVEADESESDEEIPLQEAQRRRPRSVQPTTRRQG